MPGGGAALMEHFEALIDDLAGDGVAFERSQMFGSPGLRLPGKGKFFCCLRRGRPHLSGSALSPPDSRYYRRRKCGGNTSNQRKGGGEGGEGQLPRAALTTSLAWACTSARWSSPWKDSA